MVINDNLGTHNNCNITQKDMIYAGEKFSGSNDMVISLLKEILNISLRGFINKDKFFSFLFHSSHFTPKTL